MVDFIYGIGQSCAVIRIVLLLSLAVLLSGRGPAAERTLVAEGDYVDQGRPDKHPAHWKLWHLQNGEYEVVEALAGYTRVVQVFYFDSHFLPRAFSLTIDPGSPKNRGKVSFTIHPTIISCRYNTEDLSCATENNGTKTATSIVPKQPYVLRPGEFYALDYAWFMTGVLQLAKHNEARDQLVYVYALADDKIREDGPIKLTYAGEVTARVMGRVQSVTEYQASLNRHQPLALPIFPVIRVNAQGLVVSVGWGANPETGFAMDNYRQYEPWSLSR